MSSSRVIAFNEARCRPPNTSLAGGEPSGPVGVSNSKSKEASSWDLLDRG